MREDVFHPIARREIDRVNNSDKNVRFAHYTTAETAFKIISTKKMWMRSTLVMNDLSEVHHGVELITKTIENSPGVLKTALDLCHEGLFDEVRDEFIRWSLNIRYDTFICCFSEHDVNDDRFGRLSMWRAYGGRAGVALVFKKSALFNQSPNVSAYSSPVSYLSEGDVELAVETLAGEIHGAIVELKQRDRANVRRHTFEALRFASMCIKHKGFSEEREWRVISSPSINAIDQVNGVIERELVVLNGVPQEILSINLRDKLECSISGLEFKDIIDRVIIGPCQSPEVIYRSLCEALNRSGVDNPRDIVFRSDIPLRTD